MHRYLFDENGNLRQFAQEAVSCTISTDHGKGLWLQQIFLFL